MEITTISTQETKKLAQRIAVKLNPGSVLALYGELGSGKTTFTRFLVEALGIAAKVQSPTFTIHKRYFNKPDNVYSKDKDNSKNTDSKNDHNSQEEIKIVNHLDFYRLTDTEELLEYGMQDIFYEKNAITVIEWPEIIEQMLPKQTIRIKIKSESETVRVFAITNLEI